MRHRLTRVYAGVHRKTHGDVHNEAHLQKQNLTHTVVQVHSFWIAKSAFETRFLQFSQCHL